MQSTVSYETLVPEAAGQLAQGAFLVSGREEKNLMTIGWGQWGRVWGTPVCTVLVRKTRYSHTLVERDGVFTVSVPLPDAMKKELGFCGTKSGRDVNKLESLGLSTLPARAGGVDGLKGCVQHFECRVVFKLEMAGHLSELAEELRTRFYNPEQQEGDDGNPHTVYFGEILAAYRTDG